MYRDKTPPEKETSMDEEQGSGHLIGKLEMVPKGQLQKGSSLPKQSLARQDSAVKIVKALSMPPFELHSLSLRKQREYTEETGAKTVSTK
jgi:hypothetical protein